MAADSRGYGCHRYPIGTKAKVERLHDGTLLGASSNVPGGAETVREWWRTREAKNKDLGEIELPASFTLLVVEPNGEAYYASDTRFVSGPLKGDFFAIGSGVDYALGAMKMGATAVEAVRVGCQLDVWSDLPIYAVRHDVPARWRVDK